MNQVTFPAASGPCRHGEEWGVNEEGGLGYRKRRRGKGGGGWGTEGVGGAEAGKVVKG